MFWNRFALGLLPLALALAGGCQKSAPTGQPSTASPQPPSGSIHWLGLKQIAADTNRSASFMAIWTLPETVKLKEQTLDKLALWAKADPPSPGSGAAGIGKSGNRETKGASLIRPLLDDLVQEEWYLEVSPIEVRSPKSEVRSPESDVQSSKFKVQSSKLNVGSSKFAPPPSSPSALSTINSQLSTLNSWALAIHLSPERAALWQTSLAPWLTNPAPRIACHTLQFPRSDQWTLITSASAAKAFTSGLAARIQTNHALLSIPATNLWLEATLDLHRLLPTNQPSASSLQPSAFPSALPSLSLTLATDGGALRTRGQLTFDKPLPLQMEPWIIPTNVLGGPFTSFTAARGLAPWLASLKVWNDLHVGAPPNQLYAWALQQFDAQSYFAAPHPDASNVVSRLADLALKAAGSKRTATDWLNFEKSSSVNGLEWKSFPMMSPFFQSVLTNGQPVIFGGLFPPPPVAGEPPPPELLQQLLARTNMIYYDSEVTGPRVAQLIFVGQTLRLVSGKPQLPTGSVGMAWLNALAPKLDNSVTAVSLTAPNQLSLSRVSRIGLTAAELHLLADWLESPAFPKGLHTLSAPPPQN